MHRCWTRCAFRSNTMQSCVCMALRAWSRCMASRLSSVTRTTSSETPLCSSSSSSSSSSATSYRFELMFAFPVRLHLLTVFISPLSPSLQYVFVYLANLRVRRLGWRGLWVTKHIEGTVDDDVAAKLAIGEGRQAGHLLLHF